MIHPVGLMLYALVVWLATQAVSAAIVWLFTVDLGRPVSAQAQPRVAVIVAVKGHDIEFDGFLASVFVQDYSDYRVIFAVESDSDPAVAAIEVCRARWPDKVSLVTAGLARAEGQKTANLRAALDHVTAEDDILVFADADIWPNPDWLRRLVAPLVRGETDVVSGFAWLLVKDSRPSTFVLASMAAGIATIPRMPFLNAAWGGTTAMWRDQFESLGIADNWRGALSDDLQLTNVVQRAGCRIAAPREILLRTPVETHGFSTVAAEARRWYMLVRVHMPVTYAITVAASTLVSAGWIAALVGALCGRTDAAIVLMSAFALAILCTFGRAILIARLWGRAGLKENRAFLLADPLMAPVAAIMNAVFGWSALGMRRTTWAGITYEITGPQEVRILARGES